MKLKKNVKITLVVILFVILVGAGFYAYKTYFTKPVVTETKILNSIEEFGYTLKDNKSKEYGKKFNELVKILGQDSIDEESYVSKITEMFILDFYSLNEKTAKTDIGGVEFVHPDILQNFLQNAENTYYKYVESNIYNNRKQDLPTVSEISIDSIEKVSYGYSGKTDEAAYKVKVNWTYTDAKYDDYQKNATLIFVHENKILYLVELQ